MPLREYCPLYPLYYILLYPFIPYTLYPIPNSSYIPVVLSILYICTWMAPVVSCTLSVYPFYPTAHSIIYIPIPPIPSRSLLNSLYICTWLLAIVSCRFLLVASLASACR
ncbi:hypothetical protein B484DRAFT_457886 [Ochromonadaceae sp. CCMP2298]|nr:hypothetical protein B484DRAFT_457886 [Ochromonadaceae sp. CCMP2298]